MIRSSTSCSSANFASINFLSSRIIISSPFIYADQSIDEVPIWLELAFLNLLFYHFLPLLSTNLLILFRIFHTIAENFKKRALKTLFALSIRVIWERECCWAWRMRLLRLRLAMTACFCNSADSCFIYSYTSEPRLQAGPSGKSLFFSPGPFFSSRI